MTPCRRRVIRPSRITPHHFNSVYIFGTVCRLIVNIALLKGRRTIDHQEVGQDEPVT